MPTINPTLVPTVAPGNLFTRLTTDDTLNVRWLTALDPVYFESANRPHADIVLRQLILAKALDALQVSLGHQVLFPFVVQPQIASGTDFADVPLNWIWDISLSLPKKWEQLRLAKIKRVSGDNSNTSGYSGKLRLIFTAAEQNSSTEVAIFSADYTIDSDLTYQIARLTVITDTEETVRIASGEAETVSGFLIFRTLSPDDLITANFYDTVAPPDDTTDSDSDGFFDDPAVYEIIDSNPGGSAVTDDFDTIAVSHGTGLLTSSAWNAIPPLDSDIQSWIQSFNYPFTSDANRTSVNGIVIPIGLFREFDITAPAGDEPSGDTTGTFFPVWVRRIERVGTGSQLRFYFATHNVTDLVTGGTPSLTPVEFATLDLLDSYVAGDIVEIVPYDDLQLRSGSDDDWEQHFGRGHVVLSSLWGGTSSDIADFFSAFDAILDTPTDTEFSTGSSRISSFGVSRVPKYVPTIGQSRALLGSTSRRTTAIAPSYDNRYVTEQDQGLGNRIDLEAVSGITPHVALDRYGYSGSLAHKVIKLAVDASQMGDSPTFYTTHVLPRLVALLGRQPSFGDWWYDGTRLRFFNGDLWQS